jgi:prenylcysteine oxidase/farnesylcysteine lyase
MSPVPVEIPKVTYMTLHVTLLATHAKLNPAAFNMNTPVPVVILTTLPAAGKRPIFNSISRIRILPSGESVFKIFSPEAMTDEILAELFIDGSMDWIYRKVWQAYPRLDPIEEFAPIQLYPSHEDTPGVWYTSGIESFISTMETSALSGRNIAALLAKQLWEEDTT